MSLVEVIISAWNNVQKMYLNAFKKNKLSFIVTVFSIALYPFWCYIFIKKYSLGAFGSSMANLASICFTYSFALFLTYNEKELSFEDSVSLEEIF